ncbi:hydantoinase/oxoprolinase family protein [Algicella marina]|uniref:Hydantoinase/oxoprolinase family protein n=1 Tax=Algicella marina TaxID=2683284 RepID=A0A6P1SY63_9RHOB|nr:hydantoinase/oxoprolinase family protein [Algicella marina]QHQ34146.1 hydantoinase/oxoprolinase family protein [Algicella marina]
MGLLLGLDTGGTYTDAVLFEEGAVEPVRQTAKALTTHQDLSCGLAAAIDAVLADGDVDPVTIALVSLSTTLATNALVEGRGGRAALVFIGFEEADATRGGLAEALAGDPLIHVPGGHSPSGQPCVPLGLAELEDAAKTLKGQVEGIAIVSAFASRNTAHEEEAARLLRAATGLPVTCGHELSARLGGPKRAVTTLLNARLIGLISGLISATESALAARGITAPLMLVRGDGALVSAAFARQRPIETILSGPAASLVGAAVLTGAQDAVVADIGGTTTDIAILQGGRPRLSPDGAEVGGFRTMVEAVDMRAVGLGGDSRVRLDPTLEASLTLGPDRALPLSLLVSEHPHLLTVLEAEAARPLPSEFDASFARATGHTVPGSLPASETSLLSRLAAGPLPLSVLLVNRTDRAHLRRLASRGLIRIAAFTPSDAAHLLGLQSGWNSEAARLGAFLMARQRDGRGQPVAASPEAFARRVLARLEEFSAEAILAVTLRADGLPPDPTHPFIRAGLTDSPRITRLTAGLTLPLIGLGAAAPTYYPGIARRLGSEALIPREAGVANAIGAVAGRISIRRSVHVSTSPDGGFAVHTRSTPTIYPDLPAATQAALQASEAAARAAAIEAGADTPEVTVSFHETRATVEGRPVFIEGEARAEAAGRPRHAAR